MRLRWMIAMCLPLMAFAAAAGAGPAPPGGTQACDVTLNVTDPDPNGLNVRDAPSIKGSVVGVLKPDGEWTSVHVIGQQGEWLSIDRAETIDDNAKGGSRTVLHRPGWVHASKLGVSELFTGSGTVLRDRPDAGGAVLVRIRDEDSSSTQVLGCKGKFIQVRHQGRTGWTDTWCNNERTTCS